MCKNSAAQTKPPARHVSSWTTISGIVFLLFVATAPLLLSEMIGGWTRKYTSPVKFSTASIGDMTGKVVIVTGANTGIGYHTALELARNGAQVIATSRSVSRGEAALTKMKQELSSSTSSSSNLPSINVQFLQLDLASLDSVQSFATEFLKLGLPLHILVLNAGVMKSPGSDFVGQSMKYGFETTKDGFEYHIGVNHIAHAYLTRLLTQKLVDSAPSRVVSVSSSAEQSAYKQGMVFEDWIPTNGEMPEDYEDGNAYGQSKLANLMYANELASQLNGTGVTAYALHPGVIHTELSRYMVPHIEEQMNSAGVVLQLAQRLFFGIFQFAMFSAEDGALCQLHVATADGAELANGAMYHPIGRVVTPTHAQGQNMTLQKMLWDETEKAIEQRGNYRK